MTERGEHAQEKISPRPQDVHSPVQEGYALHKTMFPHPREGALCAPTWMRREAMAKRAAGAEGAETKTRVRGLSRKRSTNPWAAAPAQQPDLRGAPAASPRRTPRPIGAYAPHTPSAIRLGARSPRSPPDGATPSPTPRPSIPSLVPS